MGSFCLLACLLACLVLIWWQTQFLTFLHTLSYSFLKHKADANILTLQVRKNSQTLNPFLSTPSCHRFPAMKTSEFTLVLTPSSTRLTVPVTLDCLWPYSVSLNPFYLYIFFPWELERRYAPVDKSTGCYFRIPGFSSQHSRGSSQPPLLQPQGSQCLLRASVSTARMWYTDIHSDKGIHIEQE